MSFLVGTKFQTAWWAFNAHTHTVIPSFGNTEQELIDQINAARASNIFEISDLNIDTKNGFPMAIELFQNYPNPFNPTTSITFNLSETLDVNLSIYNILEKKVHTAIDERLLGEIHKGLVKQTYQRE